MSFGEKKKKIITLSQENFNQQGWQNAEGSFRKQNKIKDLSCFSKSLFSKVIPGRIWCKLAVPDGWGNMANTGGMTMDGDMMRHAEYSVKDKMKSDAEIDRTLVGFGFHP